MDDKNKKLFLIPGALGLILVSQTNVSYAAELENTEEVVSSVDTVEVEEDLLIEEEEVVELDLEELEKAILDAESKVADEYTEESFKILNEKCIQNSDYNIVNNAYGKMFVPTINNDRWVGAQ